MKYGGVAACLALGLGLGACGQAPEQSATVQSVSSEPAAQGRPYELPDTQVWSLPDPVSGRAYEVAVYLPSSYEQEPNRRYPVLFVSDAPYAFPVIRSIAIRVGDRQAGLEEFIIVGLSYAAGDDSRYSRNRDYTPVPTTDAEAAKSGPYGGAEAYRVYIRDQVIPFVESRYRTDPDRRTYMGHSYGALLGAHTLFTEPAMFSRYILGSPSLWYAGHHMMQVEEAYARQHKDLAADVFLYVGGFEAARPDDPRYNRATDMVADMKAFERRLRSRGYANLKVEATVVQEEDHLTVFPSGLTRALRHMFPARPEA